MSVTLQVLYPAGEGLTFDAAYYTSTHAALVTEHWGDKFSSQTASKGLAGGPDQPPGFHAIYTAVFPDKGAFDAAMAVAGPIFEDVPNYYSGAPTMLIGETLF